jgi:hypothetical protein
VFAWWAQGFRVDPGTAVVGEPLYPRVRGKRRPLEEDHNAGSKGQIAQELLDQVPDHLQQQQLVDNGQVLVCLPQKPRKPSAHVHPYATVLQVVALRAADLLWRSGRFLEEAWWDEVSLGQ